MEMYKKSNCFAQGCVQTYTLSYTGVYAHDMHRMAYYNGHFMRQNVY